MAFEIVAATLRHGIPIDFSRSQCSGNFQYSYLFLVLKKEYLYSSRHALTCITQHSDPIIWFQIGKANEGYYSLLEVVFMRDTVWNFLDDNNVLL